MVSGLNVELVLGIPFLLKILIALITETQGISESRINGPHKLQDIIGKVEDDIHIRVAGSIDELTNIVPDPLHIPLIIPGSELLHILSGSLHTSLS